MAALAGGHSFAPAVGIAAAVAFVLMILFFRMASMAGTDENGIALSSDLLVGTEDPGTDERYLARYRSAE
ncbi:hypothetical protein [Prescottella sp. R16]|uniref:hypothetical protein n=1 Tax=Prescottella sp. R16 TaxID=3064529 RepID=UPI00272E0EDC|nr:hypothetical protein [Prescottella sp. R16]